jgi:hypothetical protein
VLRQSLFNAVLHCLMSGVPRHFVVLSLLFHLCAAVRGGLLQRSGRVGVGSRERRVGMNAVPAMSVTAIMPAEKAAFKLDLIGASLCAISIEAAPRPSVIPPIEEIKLSVARAL